jgi:dolichol-phosphate mannosyltransferase
VTATTIARSLVERAWARTAHFSRFTAVGAAGLAVNQAAFWLLEDHMHYLVAAALATIASTTFNFTFIEAWVFRGRSRPGIGGLTRRFAAYGGVNSAALLFRLPLLYVLVSWLGMSSVWGNLLTLVALTLVRFTVSDRLIWPSRQTIPAEAQ